MLVFHVNPLLDSKLPLFFWDNNLFFIAVFGHFPPARYAFPQTKKGSTMLLVKFPVN